MGRGGLIRGECKDEDDKKKTFINRVFVGYSRIKDR